MEDRLILRIRMLRAKRVPDERILKTLQEEGFSAEDLSGAFAKLALEAHGVSATPAPVGRSGPDWLLVLFLFIVLAGGAILYRYGSVIEQASSAAIAQWGGNRVTLSDAPFVPFNPLPAVETANSVVETTREAVSPARAGNARPSRSLVPSILQSGLGTQYPAPAPQAIEVPAPVVTLSASASGVAFGAPVTLTWSSTNANTCRASSGFSTRGATSGSATDNPFLNSSYTVTCNGEGGTSKASVFVKVALPGESAKDTGPIVAASPNAPAPSQTPSVPQQPAPSETPATSTAPSSTSSSTPSTPSTPPPTPVPPAPAPEPVPPAPSGTYAVYPGCESPSSSFARAVYIDPLNGADTNDGSATKPLATLAGGITAKKIVAGDHIVFLPGAYPRLSFPASFFSTSAPWTWADFRPGAIVPYLSGSGVHRLLVTGAQLHRDAHLNNSISWWSGGGSNLIIADSRFYGTEDSSHWTVEDWKNADGGLGVAGTSCVSVLRNTFFNMRTGIGINNPGSSKTLVMDNHLKNIGGDGINPLASDIRVTRNSIVDEYADPADGDPNHDDAIQVFVPSGVTGFDNIVIDHNWIQETTDPNRPLIGGLQGISSFDGWHTNVRVENNVVITSVWHGIAWYGSDNVVIDHNTAVNYTSNGRNTWIKTNKSKDGRLPVNAHISNNAAVSVFGASGTTVSDNVNVRDPASAYRVFNPAGNQYDLSAKSGGILDGKDVGAQITQLALAPHASENQPLLAAAGTAPTSWFHSLIERLRAVLGL